MTSETAPNPNRIPIRNIWLLLLYASALFRDIDGRRRATLEENPDDIPDLIAEILAYEVDRRLARNLSAGWQPRQADLTRVRGRIDLRRTETHSLLQRGRVACKFNEITINTPRNRLVRAALARLAAITGRQDAAGQATNVAARCRALAARLERLGVGPEKPPPTEVSIDTFGRLDANDKVMVGAARLAFDLALPYESANPAALNIPRREVDWRLYEMAIYGFYKVTLSPPRMARQPRQKPAMASPKPHARHIIHPARNENRHLAGTSPPNAAASSSTRNLATLSPAAGAETRPCKADTSTRSMPTSAPKKTPATPYP